MDLSHWKDALAQAAHGMTRREAHELGVCIECRQPPVCLSDLERREYAISALCPYCFDRLTEAPDE